MGAMRSPWDDVAARAGLCGLEALEPRIVLSSTDMGDQFVPIDGDFRANGVAKAFADIGVAEECDFFRFTARSSGEALITVRERQDSSIDSILTILDAGLNVVDMVDDEGRGGLEKIRLDVESGEMFYAQVGALESGSGSTGAYKVRVLAPQDEPPAEPFGSASDIDSGFDADGIFTRNDSIDDRFAQHFFRFTARDDGTAGFILREQGNSSIDSRLTIHNENGEVIRLKDGQGPGGREQARIPVVEGMTYFLRIDSGFATDGQTGEYKIRVKAPVGDLPDDEPVEATEIEGIPVSQATDVGSGNATFTGQTRLFKFTAAQGGDTTITTGVGRDLNVRMNIYDVFGTQLASVDEHGPNAVKRTTLDLDAEQMVFIVARTGGGVTNIGGISTADATTKVIAETSNGPRIADAGLRADYFDLEGTFPLVLPDFNSLPC